MVLTELLFTHGSWGMAPMDSERMIRIVDRLVSGASKLGISLRLEVYAEHEEDLKTLDHVVYLESTGAPVTAVARLEPRSDRLRRISYTGVRQVVIDVPVSVETATARFKPGGLARAAEFAAEQSVAAVLAGLQPEIALVDITRARGREVRPVVEAVEYALRSRGIQARYRLVDSLGLGLPLPGARRPRSLSAWVRWFDRELHIDPPRLAVQSANTLGMALPSILSASQSGSSPVGSLFGRGHHTGWAASELICLHLLDPWADLRGWMKIHDLLPDEAASPTYPFSGTPAWRIPGGTHPEEVEKRISLYLPFDPRKICGQNPEPMLDNLSGLAGILHLTHRHYPHLHIDTEDVEAHALAAEVQEEFDKGRCLPLTWPELHPRVQKTGILERAEVDERVEKKTT